MCFSTDTCKVILLEPGAEAKCVSFEECFFYSKKSPDINNGQVTPYELLGQCCGDSKHVPQVYNLKLWEVTEEFLFLNSIDTIYWKYHVQFHWPQTFQVTLFSE